MNETNSKKASNYGHVFGDSNKYVDLNKLAVITNEGHCVFIMLHPMLPLTCGIHDTDPYIV